MTPAVAGVALVVITLAFQFFVADTPRRRALADRLTRPMKDPERAKVRAGMYVLAVVPAGWAVGLTLAAVDPALDIWPWWRWVLTPIVIVVIVGSRAVDCFDAAVQDTMDYAAAKAAAAVHHQRNDVARDADEGS